MLKCFFIDATRSHKVDEEDMVKEWVAMAAVTVARAAIIVAWEVAMEAMEEVHNRSKLLNRSHKAWRLILLLTRRDAYAEAGWPGGSMGGSHHGHGGGHGGGQGGPPMQK